MIGRRRVDRHRHAHLVERDIREQRLHVLERVDRDPLAPDLAAANAGGRSRGPSARACRRPSRAPSGRARGGSGSAGWSPRAVPNPANCRIVHSRPRYIDGYTPRVYGIFAGQPDRLVWIGREVALGVERLDRLAGDRREQRVALRGGGETLALPALEVRLPGRGGHAQESTAGSGAVCGLWPVPTGSRPSDRHPSRCRRD